MTLLCLTGSLLGGGCRACTASACGRAGAWAPSHHHMANASAAPLLGGRTGAEQGCRAVASNPPMCRRRWECRYARALATCSTTARPLHSSHNAPPVRFGLSMEAPGGPQGNRGQPPSKQQQSVQTGQDASVSRAEECLALAISHPPASSSRTTPHTTPPVTHTPTPPHTQPSALAFPGDPVVVDGALQRPAREVLYHSLRRQEQGCGKEQGRSKSRNTGLSCSQRHGGGSGGGGGL